MSSVISTIFEKPHVPLFLGVLGISAACYAIHECYRSDKNTEISYKQFSFSVVK